MKRFSVLLLTIMLVLTPSFSMAAALDTHGRDSSSQSMSVGAEKSEAPTETENEKVEASADDEGAASDDEDEIEVEDATDEDIAAEKKAQAAAERAPIIRTAITIAVALCALGAAIMLLRSRRKDKYKGKH